VLRNLFGKTLPVVFENSVVKGTNWGPCEVETKLVDLASCGGDFAVDLTEAFAAAQKRTILEETNSENGWNSDEPRRRNTLCNCQRMDIGGGGANMNIAEQDGKAQEDVVAANNDNGW
jgi:hypothetical protein